MVSITLEFGSLEEAQVFLDRHGVNRAPQAAAAEVGPLPGFRLHQAVRANGHLYRGAGTIVSVIRNADNIEGETTNPGLRPRQALPQYVIRTAGNRLIHYNADDVNDGLLVAA